MAEQHHEKLIHPKGWGADLSFEERPGVPKLKAPVAPLEGSRRRITQQARPAKMPTKRMELSSMTPVFGTAQLPHGASGLVRRLAYRIPEHWASHWMLLLGADRVDFWGHRLIKGARALAIGGSIAAGGWAIKQLVQKGMGRRRLLATI